MTATRVEPARNRWQTRVSEAISSGAQTCCLARCQNAGEIQRRGKLTPSKWDIPNSLSAKTTLYARIPPIACRNHGY